MPLSIEQIRALIEGMTSDIVARAERLKISVEYESQETGESIELTHSYSLEGLYPVRETSADEPAKENVCVLCDANVVEVGHTFCKDCEEAEREGRND